MLDTTGSVDQTYTNSESFYRLQAAMDSSVPNPFLIDELDANSQPQMHPTHVQPQQQIIAGDTHGGISSCCTVTSTTTTTTTTAHRPGPPMRPPPPHGVAKQETPSPQPPKSAFDDLNDSIRFALEGSPSKLQANATLDQKQMPSNVGFGGGVAASVGGSQHPAPQQQSYSSTSSSSTSQPLVGGP